jgi:glycosyltransferase involved in cell wall biosynthesis
MRTKYNHINVNARIPLRSSTGVGRYFRNIMHHMPKKESVNFNILYPDAPFFKFGLFGHLWDQFRFLFLTNITWLPTHAGSLLSRNYYVTIHDLQPILYPKYFNYFFVFWYKISIGIHVAKSKKIFVVSNFVKKALEENYSKSKGKIVVHWNGYEHLKKIKLKKIPIERNYAVILGTVSKHKLSIRNIRIWLNSDNNNYYLYIIGSVSNDEKKEFLELLNSNKQLIYLENLRDEEMFYVLKHSSYLLFISPFEGFGIPALEAVYYSIPVIYPNNSAIDEILNGYGVGVNAFDQNEISKAIESVKQINVKSEKYCKLRKKILDQYRWKTSAKIIFNNLKK